MAILDPCLSVHQGQWTHLTILKVETSLEEPSCQVDLVGLVSISLLLLPTVHMVPTLGALALLDPIPHSALSRTEDSKPSTLVQ